MGREQVDLWGSWRSGPGEFVVGSKQERGRQKQELFYKWKWEVLYRECA